MIPARLIDPASVAFAEMTAEVTAPGLPALTIALRDGARGYDGARGDGIYSASAGRHGRGRAARRRDGGGSGRESV